MWEGVHHMLTNSGCYQLVSLLRESILFRCVFIHSCGHVWMWELDCEEGWAPKTWCFWTVVLENTLASPLDCKESQPVHPKGDQSWVFIGRTDAEAQTPILWPHHAKNWLIGKDSDAGRDGVQEEKVTTEDEMAGWHHWLDGCESEWTPGVGDGQGGLACCNSWGLKESDTTEQLNWSECICFCATLSIAVLYPRGIVCSLCLCHYPCPANKTIGYFKNLSLFLKTCMLPI